MAGVVTIGGTALSSVDDTREPNANLIKFLEDTLEMAKAGQVIGMACASISHDLSAQWATVGMVGGFNMVGALDAVKYDVLMTALGEDD